MDGLKETVMTVLDVKRKGGLLITRDSNTIILANYDHASQAGLAYITDQYPRTNITMSQSSTSTSGYIICFTRMYTHSLYTSSPFLHLLFTVCIIWTLMAYFWTSCLLNFVD